MPYKLIILDLDHTLLKEDLTLSDHNARTLARCQAQGVSVTIATGRMLHSALPHALTAGGTLPIITCQGALLSTLSGAVINRQPLANQTARQLLSLLAPFPLDVICCHNDQVYAASAREDYRYQDTLPKLGHHHLPLPDDIGDIEPLKIGANGAPEAIAQACAAVNAALGEAIHAVQSSPYFLESTHPAATKSRAAAILAQRLGIDHEEIIAFGDSMNDLDLLQFAGMGVAVANAAPQVLAAADYITDTNENDGVAKALAELL